MTDRRNSMAATSLALKFITATSPHHHHQQHLRRHRQHRQQPPAALEVEWEQRPSVSSSPRRRSSCAWSSRLSRVGIPPESLTTATITNITNDTALLTAALPSVRTIELLLHLPSHTTLQRVQVPANLPFVALRALIQRHHGVRFQDQRVFLHGDQLTRDSDSDADLDQLEDLASYDIVDQSVLHVETRPRYRRIGDVHATIRAIRFLSQQEPVLIAQTRSSSSSSSPPSASTSSTSLVTSSSSSTISPSELAFEYVEIVAPLPPLRHLMRYLVTIVSYLHRLDHLQYVRTRHRIWKHLHVVDASTAKGQASTEREASRERVGRDDDHDHGGDDDDDDDDDSECGEEDQVATLASKNALAPLPSALVMRRCGGTITDARPSRTEIRVQVPIPDIVMRLQLAPNVRSPMDIHLLTCWLGSLHFFASASLPLDALQAVARQALYLRIPAGGFLFRQGDVGDTFYLLLSGHVSLAAYGSGHFATLSPGAAFGELSLAENTRSRVLRTASAVVDFTDPCAQLAVVSGMLYRRVINPFKQAVQLHAEDVVASIPQFVSLPSAAITHLAYNATTLSVSMGERLIQKGEHVQSLVLLVKGDVKVTNSTTTRGSQSPQQTGGSASHGIVPSRELPVVGIVRAPAVFGQETCLSSIPTPAPWHISALTACELVCLSANTVSVFLAPRHDIIRALNAEHTRRLREFQRRFTAIAVPTMDGGPVSAQDMAAAADQGKPSRQSQMTQMRRLATSRAILEGNDNDMTQEDPFGREWTPRASSSAVVAFPSIALPPENETISRNEKQMGTPLDSKADRRRQSTVLPSRRPASERGRSRSPRYNTRSSQSNPSQRFGTRSSPSSPSKPAHRPSIPARLGSPLTCAQAQDQVLHMHLPFSQLLPLRDQIRFVSFAQQRQRETAHGTYSINNGNRLPPSPRARSARIVESDFSQEIDVNERDAEMTIALLEGLRSLQSETVELSPPTAHDPVTKHGDQMHYRFTPCSATSSLLLPSPSKENAPSHPCTASTPRHRLHSR